MSGTEYEQLADAAERGQLQAVPGSRRTGEDARAFAGEVLMQATGAPSVEEAARLAIGRPRLGQDRGPSRQWRIRASEELNSATEAVAAQEGLTVSELVRRATAEYVAARKGGHAIHG